MFFRQYYLECLSQASYLIGDETTGDAVIVDPRRDVDEYLADAEEAGLTIKGIILTHFHADFVSGHLEMAQETGAWIGYGEAANPEFEIRKLADGERISLGDVTLEIMATPGHTPESISVLVFEHADDEVAHGVLTGDALFIGDVGRPDLLASAGVTSEQLGAMLYDSIQHKLMGLPDEVRLFPGHGAGSACGKNLSTALSCTIGVQRETNYACQPMTEQEFIDIVAAGQPSAPKYFGFDATINKELRNIRDLDTTVPQLDADAVLAAIESGVAVLDSRDPEIFAASHLKGSINVGFDGRMAETAGTVFDPKGKFVVVANPGQEQQTALRMTRIGFDGCIGYADLGEILAAKPELEAKLRRVDASELNTELAKAGVQFLDIRNPGEREGGQLLDAALHLPLAELTQRVGELDAQRPVLIHCASGYRSLVAMSWLATQGFDDVADVRGGYDAITEELVH